MIHRTVCQSLVCLFSFHLLAWQGSAFAQDEATAGKEAEAAVEAPVRWREWAERQRASAEKNKAENDHLRSIYERVSSYGEIRRKLFIDGDIEFAEKGLRALFSKISDPLAAEEYSLTIEKISAFTYDIEPEELRATMQRWTEEHPQSHFGWLVRGNLAIRYGWYWRGSGYANSVTPEGWRKFGEAIDEAAECLEKAYALEPNDPEISAAMIAVCKAQSRPRNEMEKYFSRAVKIAPSHTRAHSEKFEYLLPMWSGSVPEYQEFMDSLNAKIAQQNHPMLRIAHLAARDRIENIINGDPDQETTQRREQEWYEVRKACAEHWPDSARFRGYYLVMATETKRYDETIPQYEWFGNRYPTDIAWDLPRYHHNRVYRLIMQAKRLPEAERAAEFDRILAIDPESSVTHHYIGMAYSQLGEYELAEPALLRAIELDIGNGSSFYVLASIYDRMGRDEDALAVIQQSKEHDLQDNIEASLKEIEAKILERVETGFKPLVTPQ